MIPSSNWRRVDYANCTRRSFHSKLNWKFDTDHVWYNHDNNIHEKLTLTRKSFSLVVCVAVDLCSLGFGTGCFTVIRLGVVGGVTPDLNNFLTLFLGVGVKANLRLPCLTGVFFSVFSVPPCAVLSCRKRSSSSCLRDWKFFAMVSWILPRRRTLFKQWRQIFCGWPSSRLYGPITAVRTCFCCSTVLEYNVL